MTKIKNIMKYIASIFLVILVFLCIYTFIVTDIMKKDYVNIFGNTYFVVATGSMSGTIEVDDVIFVHLTKNVKENDIITFKSSDGDIITHRLIQKNGSNYVTKGDVNNVNDETITKDQIIGKVVFSVSPSFILKSIAVFLIIFVLLALINFDGIIRKYIIKDKGKDARLPDDIFVSPGRKVEEKSSGLTVTIDLKEMEDIGKKYEKEQELTETVEVLGDVEYLFEEDKPIGKREEHLQEKETVDFVLSILKSKKSRVSKTKMNKKWLEKYQYVYKLCQIISINNTECLIEEINNPPFEEIYDYDLEKVGLTVFIRNRIYHMPIYVFLQLLTYAILYNDDEMFDGIYKILKYKVLIDADNRFIKISFSNRYAMKQINEQISFMKVITNKFDNKKVFELDKIERMVKIKNY